MSCIFSDVAIIPYKVCDVLEEIFQGERTKGLEEYHEKPPELGRKGAVRDLDQSCVLLTQGLSVREGRHAQVEEAAQRLHQPPGKTPTVLQNVKTKQGQQVLSLRFLIMILKSHKGKNYVN